jgi:hypothetical protein
VGLMGRGRRAKAGRAKTPAGEQSCYEQPHNLPSVNQMHVAGGQGYDWGAMSYVPAVITPSPASVRIQTPIVRVGAFLRLSTDHIPGDRGRMWCR